MFVRSTGREFEDSGPHLRGMHADGAGDMIRGRVRRIAPRKELL